MSEEQQNNSPPPQLENTSASGKKSAEKKPPVSRARRWRRRLTWLVVLLLASSAISRLLIIFILPPVMRHVAKAYGLTASYERLELYVIEGDVGIWHLNLSPIEGGDPLIQSEYARCDISLLDLLRGRLSVRRLEAEGIDLLVERKADGSIPLFQRFNSRAVAATPPAAASSTARQIDLTSPLQIDTFRLTDIRAHVVDSAVSPRLDANVSLSMRLTDVDSPFRPAHFEMELSAPPILDLLHVEGTGTSQGKQLQADLEVLVQGIHPVPASGYLLPLGIQPTAHSISLRMNASLKTTVSTTRPDGIAASLKLSDMAAVADGQDAAGLDNITLDADAIDFSTASIRQFLIEGAHCQARRNDQGLIGIAGFDLVPPSAPPSRSAPASSSSAPFIPKHWSLGELELRDLGATLEDQKISPNASLAFHLDDLTVQNISPDQPQPPSPIHGRFTVPGIIDAITLDGQTQPFAATRTFDIKLSAQGIKPDALHPYLDSLGLQSDYTSGTFTASLHADASQGPDGSFVSNAALTDVTLQDNTSNFLDFDAFTVSGASYDPAVGRVRIKAIDISGPQIIARRDTSGDFSGFGFQTKPRISSPSPASATRPSASASQFIVPSLPKLRIDRFTWKNIRIRFDDLAVVPQSSLAISDAGVELTNFNLDFDPASTAPSSGQIRAWLVAPHLAPSITAAGSVNPAHGGFALDLSVDGKGITTDALHPYFLNSRIQPALHDGNFHLDTHLALASSDDRATASLDVKNLLIKDGSSDLLALDAARIDNLVADSSGLSVHQVSLVSPRLSASRDETGTIQCLGIRLEPLPPGEPTRQNLDLTGPSQAAITSSPVHLSAGIDDLNVHQASLSWTDHYIEPAAAAHLTIDADLQNAVIGKSAPPAKLNVAIHEDKALDRLTIAGTIQPSLTDPAANLSVDASGIRAGDLAPYAPPGSSINLKNGQFHVAIDAAAHPNPAGGFSGHLLFNDLNFHDDPDAPALCHFDSAGVTASQVNPAAHVIALDEISLSGFEAAASRSSDGSLSLLGLTLGGSTPTHASPSTQPAPSTPVPPPSSPKAQAHAVTAANLARITQKKFPIISVEKLDVGVRRISVTDQSHPNSAPLALTHFKLTNSHRISLLGDDPQTAIPVDLQLAGSIDPLVKSLAVQVRLIPFDAQPRLTLDIALAGIRGSGVTDLFPDLKPQIDGSQMTDGQFKAHLALALHRQIRDPLDLDLSSGFTASVSARTIEFRDKPDGSLLAGLEEATAENIRVQPQTQTVIMPDVEVTNITAHLFRDAAGIHALGWIIKLPQPAQTASASTQPAPIAKSAPPPTPVAAPQKPSGEIAVTKLIVSGLDFSFEDRTCSPPLLVPLNSLDMEVRDISSLMPYEEKSCRFNILVNAGKFSADGRSSPEAQHDLFSQAEVTGDVSLYPRPSGWAKSSVSAFDLSALSGEAKQQGVDLGGGTFDGSADLRFRGDTVDARCRLTLTDLKVKEPSNGPIAHYLGITVPLDVAIAAVQDQDGSINIPVDVPVQSSGISGPALFAAGSHAVAAVILNAIAATPLKAADTVFSIFGKDKPKNDQPVFLTFAPADDTLSLLDILQLRALLEQMHDDDTLQLTLRHQVGGADAARAQILANPSSDDCRALAYRLQLRKSDLLQARQAAAESARAQLASGYGSDSLESIQRLREIDRALADNEDALDSVYNMLAPGAVRQSARRTRAACIQIGSDRLDAVRGALVSSGLPGIEKRIDVTHSIYNPLDNDAGGTVTIVLTHKKPD